VAPAALPAPMKKLRKFIIASVFVPERMREPFCQISFLSPFF
jgi:hypothetical protein